MANTPQSEDFMRDVMLDAAISSPIFCDIMLFGYEACGDAPMAAGMAFVSRMHHLGSAKILSFPEVH